MSERQILLEMRIEQLEEALQIELKWWEEYLANCNNYDEGIMAKNRIAAITKGITP